MSQEIVGPLTITSALGVQGGSLELGATVGTTPETPYLDFHFGLGAAQDFNVRLLNAADNRLDVVTASGGLALSIQADKIGIGTLSPAAKLVVNELAGGAEVRVDGQNGLIGLSLGADAAQPWVGTRTNHALRLLTNNTEQVRVQADGHVGIGTPQASQKLTLGSGNILLPNATAGLHGNLYFGGLTDTGQPGLRLCGGLVNGAMPAGFIDVCTTDPNDGLRIRVDTTNGCTERMRVTASGNVGIGNTTPDHMLVVGSPSGGRHLVVNDIPTARWGLATGEYNLAIQNDGSGTWETRLLITKIGHVGIGTTHAQTNRSLTLEASDAAISLQDRNVPSGNHWEIQASAFQPDPFGIVRYDANQGAQGSKSLVITNGGNVGIGTTNPTGSPGFSATGIAPFTPDRLLDIHKPDWVSGDDIQLHVGDLILNSRHTGSSGILATNERGSNGNLSVEAKGLIFFQTANPDGTTTEKVRIANNGNVGIGITNPSAHLHISGPGDRTLDISSTDAQQSSMRLMAVTSNGMTESHLQFRIRLHFVAPLGFEGGRALMSLQEDGNVGIGVPTPTHILHVKAPDAVGLFESSSNQAFLRFSTNEGLNNRVEIANRPGGRLTLWVAGGGDVLNITRNGNVGIGVPTPTHILHVKAPDAVGLFESSSNQAFLRFSTNEGLNNRVEIANRPGGRLTLWVAGGGDVLNITRNGNVGIGTGLTPAAGFKLDVAGAAHASSFPTSSDARLKTKVVPLTNVLEKLEKIHGVSFEWNEAYESLGRSTGRREIGVIAQEVEAVFPALITTWGEEGYKAIDYGRLTGVLVEAVKELKAENAILRQRVAALERVG